MPSAVLIELEAMLRLEYNCDDLLLCDYFQYVGGTSTVGPYSHLACLVSRGQCSGTVPPTSKGDQDIR